MASPKTTTTAVKLKGETILLRFDFAAADSLDMLGIDIYNPSTYDKFSPSKIVSLVWAGQLHTKLPLSREEVARNLKLNTQSYAETANAVAAAIREAVMAKE